MTAVAEQKRLLRVVELVGPAGVGKSTLTGALIRRSAAVSGSIWGQPALSLLGNGLRSGPALMRFWRLSRSPLWDESRYIVRLNTLHLSLRDSAQEPERTTIFDEGPIFALTWLRGFGHDSMRSEESDLWWRATLRDWSRLVDAVVVLDAPDSLLAGRIRARPEWHEIKHQSDRYITEWIGRFRTSLEWVLAGLAAHQGPAVIRIPVEHHCPEDLADRVFRVLDRSHAS